VHSLTELAAARVHTANAPAILKKEVRFEVFCALDVESWTTSWSSYTTRWEKAKGWGGAWIFIFNGCGS
jgi:hypothetical protein